MRICDGRSAAVRTVNRRFWFGAWRRGRLRLMADHGNFHIVVREIEIGYRPNQFRLEFARLGQRGPVVTFTAISAATPPSASAPASLAVAVRFGVRFVRSRAVARIGAAFRELGGAVVLLARVTMLARFPGGVDARRHLPSVRFANAAATPAAAFFATPGVL